MEGKRYGPPYGMQLNAKNGQISFYLRQQKFSRKLGGEKLEIPAKSGINYR